MKRGGKGRYLGVVPRAHGTGIGGDRAVGRTDPPDPERITLADEQIAIRIERESEGISEAGPRGGTAVATIP